MNGRIVGSRRDQYVFLHQDMTVEGRAKLTTIKRFESTGYPRMILLMLRRLRIVVATGISIALLGSIFLLLGSVTLPETAEAATACPLGQELYDGSCYKCDDGFDRALFTGPTSSSACERINEDTKTTATRQGDSSFLCQSGEFPDFADGSCYTCPTDHDWDVLTQKCEFRDNRAAALGGYYGCTPGTYDGLNFKCYTCSSDRFYTGIRECAKSPTNSYKAGSNTGIFGACVCPGGYGFDIAATFQGCTYAKKCIKTTTYSNVGATFAKNFGCATGTFRGGISNRCYSCPAGYSRNTALPVEIAGHCYLAKSEPRTYKRPIQFLCPAGQFLDADTNDCFSCKANFLQDAALSADATGVCYELEKQAASKLPARNSKDSCVGIGQGNCGENLVCDFRGECRNEPPEDGQFCGLSVPCKTGSADSNPGNDLDDTAGFTCISGRCKSPGGVGATCDSLVASSCADDLVCELGRCQHAEPVLGEKCDQAFNPCATQHPHLKDVGGKPQALNLTCDGPIGNAFCGLPKKFDEKCTGLGQGSCGGGLVCTAVASELDIDLDPPASAIGIEITGGKIEQRCRYEGGISNIFDDNLCNSFYDVATAQRIAGQTTTSLAYAYGTAITAGIGIAGSQETGVVYGPNGEFGCYRTNCTGIQFSAGADISACTTIDKQFPTNGEESRQFAVAVDAIPAFTDATPIGFGINVTLGYEDSDALNESTGICVFLGVGVGLPIIDVSGAVCTTDVNMTKTVLGTGNTGGQTGGGCTGVDSNGDGLPDGAAIAAGLDPASTDSDADGMADVLEVGSDCDNPMDTDGDSVIDAIESGDNANDSSIAGPVKPVPDGELTLLVNSGDALSDISTPNVTDHGPGIVFDSGGFKFTTSVPNGGSQTVSIMYDKIPASPLLFLLGPSDSVTPIPADRWSLVDPTTINVSLTDGDAGTDQDGETNGSIMATLAIGQYDNNACIGTVTPRAKSGKVQLRWNPVAGAASYDILRGTSGGDAGLSLLAADYVDPYVVYSDYQVTDEVTYAYRVIPKEADGKGLCASSAISARPTATRTTRSTR